MARRSPAKERAENLIELMKLTRTRAKREGNVVAEELAFSAQIKAENAWNAYDAAQTYGGGSSQGWELRTHGRRCLDQSRKFYERAKSALDA